MNKSLQNLNQPQLVSGVALFSTAALSVYTVKNTIEMNKRLDEIYEDLHKIKQFVTENQRKNNYNTAALGKKLEDVQNKFVNYQPQVQMQVPVQNHPVIQEITPMKVEDDIDDAVSKFLG